MLGLDLVDKVKIQGVEFNVKYQERHGMDDCLGICNLFDNTIVITQPQSVDQAEVTLLHEIIEAINMLLELELPHPKITALATALHQVYKDNFELLEVIHSEEVNPE